MTPCGSTLAKRAENTCMINTHTTQRPPLGRTLRDPRRSPSYRRGRRGRGRTIRQMRRKKEMDRKLWHLHWRIGCHLAALLGDLATGPSPGSDLTLLSYDSVSLVGSQTRLPGEGAGSPLRCAPQGEVDDLGRAHFRSPLPALTSALWMFLSTGCTISLLY